MQNVKELKVEDMQKINGGGISKYIGIPTVIDGTWEFGKGFVQGWNKGKKLSDVKFRF